MPLTIANTPLTSRLLLGTGKFQNSQQMLAAIAASKTDLVTLAMKRVDLARPDMDVLSPLAELGVRLLPNTSGARTAEEAITAAQIGRTLTQSNWVKLEIHPNPHHLLPDPIATAKAAQVLVEQGFVVLPYCSADPVLCDELAAMGCATVMPLAAPIGTNKGISMPDMLAYIIESATVPVIVDAGIGSPSDACLAMEMGADGVLVNTAIATAQDPVAMARYFAQAVETGRGAFCAGIAGEQSASATSPLTDFLSL